LHEVFSIYKKIITVEDHAIQGGFGSAVAEFMIDHNYQASIQRLGVPDRFIEHGEQKELWAECGFDSAAIMNAVRKMAGAVVFA
jgi:1-deoxy-D-xylulose-5-phosphate synthase